uniref:Uncharacterized protein n=1 Tax=Rhizophora mucronata TaxID=61149 RepID=A0A2P2Q6R8_RHIMU
MLTTHNDVRILKSLHIGIKSLFLGVRHESLSQGGVGLGIHTPQGVFSFSKVLAPCV